MKQKNVRVSTIYPGRFFTDSGLNEDWQIVRDKYGSEGMGTKEVVEAILYCAASPPTVEVEAIVLTPFPGIPR